MKKFNKIGFVGLLLVTLMGVTSVAHAVSINNVLKTDVSPGTQSSVGFTGVPVFRFIVTNSGDTADAILDLSPTPSGSVNDTLIKLYFYNDANNNGIVDLGDTNLGASAFFGVDDTIQAFDIADVAVPASGSASILVTADGTGALLNAQTFKLTFAAATSIHMNVNPSASGNTPDGYPLANPNNLTITVGPAPCTTVCYVADTGLDTNDGNIATPYLTIQKGIDSVSSGGTIKLLSNFTTNSQITVNKSITIDGDGHTLFAPFAKTDNNNNSAIGITHSDVTIQNLIEDGTGSANLHGINIYQATGVTLNNVTVSNNPRTGVVVNGSTVTVNNITTSINGWGGINVDLGFGVVSPAVLIVNGTSSQYSEAAAIVVDNITKNVSVVDTNNQYSYIDTGNLRVFTLNKITPVITWATPADIIFGTDLSGVQNATASVPGLLTYVQPADTILNVGNAQSLSVNFVPTDAISYNNVNGATVLINVLPKTITVTADSKSKVFGDTDPALTYVSSDPAVVFSGALSRDVGESVGTYTINQGTLSAGVNYNMSFTSGILTIERRGGGNGAILAIPATPAVPGVSPAVPATPAIPPRGQVLGAETFNFTLKMKLGSKSNDVKELQKRLVSEGFLPGEIDGIFGPLTKKALKAFQAEYKLSADGVVGPITLKILNSSTTVTTNTVLGCTSAGLFNTLTGKSCTVTTNTVLGCTSAGLFNTLTGKSCL